MTEDLEEMRERAALLREIAQLEQDADWTDIDDLRERVALLREIAQSEQD
jgi:hypothetical protein